MRAVQGIFALHEYLDRASKLNISAQHLYWKYYNEIISTLWLVMRNIGLCLFFALAAIGATQLIDFEYMAYVVVFNAIVVAITLFVTNPATEVLNSNKLTTVQFIVFILSMIVLVNIPFLILDSMFQVGR